MVEQNPVHSKQAVRNSRARDKPIRERLRSGVRRNRIENGHFVLLMLEHLAIDL